MANKPGIFVGNSLFTDLVYADDTALLVQSPTAAATCLSSFSEDASTLCLRISWPKTKVQNVGDGSHTPADITVDGNLVECVESFVYLGSVQPSALPDIKRRIALASSVMASLSKIWWDKCLSLTIKIRTYKALILSTLLYTAETWTVRTEDARILESFHMKCQRQILGIRWQAMTVTLKSQSRPVSPPVIDHIVKRRNAIFGQIARMPSNVPVHQALSCQVDLSLGRPPYGSWKRRPGRPPKRWLNQIRDEWFIIFWLSYRRNIAHSISVASVIMLPMPPSRCVERHCQTRSSWSDATVLDDYVLTTTTTVVGISSCHSKIVISDTHNAF